jgi:hypothetical protein
MSYMDYKGAWLNKLCKEKRMIKQIFWNIMFIIFCIVALILVYYFTSESCDSSSFFREGLTAGASAIIGGLALQTVMDIRNI